MSKQKAEGRRQEAPRNMGALPSAFCLLLSAFFLVLGCASPELPRVIKIEPEEPTAPTEADTAIPAFAVEALSEVEGPAQTAPRAVPELAQLPPDKEADDLLDWLKELETPEAPQKPQPAAQETFGPPAPRELEGPAPEGAEAPPATEPVAGEPETAGETIPRAGQPPEKVETLPGLSLKIPPVKVRGMQIPDLVRVLADSGGFNVVVHPAATGVVTLELADLSIQDYLDVMCLLTNLGYFIEKGILHVVTDELYEKRFGYKFSDRRQVRTLTLQYAAADQLAIALTEMKSSQGKIIGDPATRTLVFLDVPERLDELVAIAREMDQAAQPQTKVFPLQYAKAADVETQVQALLSKTGSVKSDKRTNTLVLTDAAQHLGRIEEAVQAFDRATRQVIIESKIIQVRLGDRFRMGVDWEALFNDVKNLRVESTFQAAPALASSGRITVGLLPSDKWTGVVEVLQGLGSTNALSTPVISVIEGEKATIHVGTKEAYVTSTVTQSQTAQSTSEEVKFVDVGVKLEVTPSINAQEMITMKIKPEVSRVQRVLITALGNEIPIIETSTAETTVMVQDGITIVIAGLIKDDAFNEEGKVPLLGDLPIFGMAFRSVDQKKEKTELVIFLTPSIISGKRSVAGVSPGLGLLEEE